MLVSRGAYIRGTHFRDFAVSFCELNCVATFREKKRCYQIQYNQKREGEEDNKQYIIHAKDIIIPLVQLIVCDYFL